MKEERLPRLLYVEDEAEMASITAEVLSEDYSVELVPDGESALELALKQSFDLMVFDRRLPGMSGTQLIEKIRRAGLATPILLLTALGTISDRVEGLDGGANDYLVKPFDFDELKARLRALLRGYQSQIVRRDIGEWTFIPSSSLILGPYGEHASLTATENRVLDVLTTNPSRVFTRQELVASCFPAGESESTVDSYIHYIRRKTDSEVIRTVRGRGYQIGVVS